MSLASNLRVLCVASLGLAATPRVSVAQSAVPERYLAPDVRLDRLAGFIRPGPGAVMTIMPDGRMILSGKNASALSAFSADGTRQPVKVNFGWNGEADLSMVSRISRTGESVWIFDGMGKQGLSLDRSGNISGGFSYPSWIHPRWADRRAFPIFGHVEVFAVYPDGDLLVRPTDAKTLLDTPVFDRKLTHLLRVTKDGAIKREIARFEGPNHVTLRGEGNSTNSRRIPLATEPIVSVSAGGARVQVLEHGKSVSDSGSYRITALGEHGDTLFSRRYTGLVVRNTQAAIDSAMRKVGGFGDQTAEQIRAGMVKRIPAFKSFVTAMFVGDDGSTWVIQRPELDSAKARIALVLDPRGEPVARVAIPAEIEPLAVDATRFWAYERAHPVLMRFKLVPAPVPLTFSQPSRSETVSKGKG